MHKTILLAALLAFVAVSASSQTSTTARKPAKSPRATTAAPKQQPQAQPVTVLKDQKEKVSYALGMTMGTNLRQQGIEIDPAVLAQGVRDGYANSKPLMTEEEASGVLMQMYSDAQARQEQKRAEEAAKTKAAGEGFLLANKNQAGVTTLPSGLQYKVLVPGNGPKPTINDTVSCNYRGTFIDGTEFDSSAKAGHPVSFPVNGVIKGWTEALQLMPVGSKWQLFIPSGLAYGERGRPGVPPNSTLVFEVELLSIEAARQPAPALPK